MKKLIALASVLSMAVFFAGCGSKTVSKSSSSGKTASKSSSSGKTENAKTSEMAGMRGSNRGNTSPENEQTSPQKNGVVQVSAESTNPPGNQKTNPQHNPNTPVPEITWLISFSEALATSKTSGKPVLINFTGKKWCGYCIRLRKEVFETADFKRWAAENVVLLELDYPRTGGGASTELIQLARKYKIRGYPTIIFANSEGSVFGKSGYISGGPSVWLRQAKRSLLNTNPTPVAGLSTVVSSTSSGVEGSEPLPQITWLTSYTDALAESKKTGKPVLADFTGKKWCGYCIKLRKEVFETAAFKQWAAKNVVLLELDYPRSGGGPSAELKDLARRYQIKGYPTVIFMDSNGAKIGKTGYMPGGPQVWLRQAQLALSNTNPTPVAAGSSGGSASGQAPKYPAGSTEYAVVQLVINLKNNNIKALNQFISSEATGLMKSLRDNPSATELKRAKSLLGRVRPHRQNASKLSDTKQQFTLVNHLGATLTFKCQKENGKYLIREMKTTRGSRRR